MKYNIQVTLQHLRSKQELALFILYVPTNVTCEVCMDIEWGRLDEVNTYTPRGNAHIISWYQV